MSFISGRISIWIKSKPMSFVTCILETIKKHTNWDHTIYFNERLMPFSTVFIFQPQFVTLVPVWAFIWKKSIYSPIKKNAKIVRIIPKNYIDLVFICSWFGLHTVGTFWILHFDNYIDNCPKSFQFYFVFACFFRYFFVCLIRAPLRVVVLPSPYSPISPPSRGTSGQLELHQPQG